MIIKMVLVTIRIVKTRRTRRTKKIKKIKIKVQIQTHRINKILRQT